MNPRRRDKAGVVRIIAGEHRGRRIRVAERAGLRPTPDRVRETLFNWLGQWLDGLSCLDLFAGTGALGFEAASRNAARVVMVENDRVSFEALERARDLLGTRQVELVNEDAQAFLARMREGFDIVFLDPPFRQNALRPALAALEKKLAPRARVYVEAEQALEAGAPWHELRRARAGQVSYQLLEKR